MRVEGCDGVRPLREGGLREIKDFIELIESRLIPDLDA